MSDDSPRDYYLFRTGAPVSPETFVRAINPRQLETVLSSSVLLSKFDVMHACPLDSHCVTAVLAGKLHVAPHLASGYGPYILQHVGGDGKVNVIDISNDPEPILAALRKNDNLYMDEAQEALEPILDPSLREADISSDPEDALPISLEMRVLEPVIFRVLEALPKNEGRFVALFKGNMVYTDLGNYYFHTAKAAEALLKKKGLPLTRADIAEAVPYDIRYGNGVPVIGYIVEKMTNNGPVSLSFLESIEDPKAIIDKYPGMDVRIKKLLMSDYWEREGEKDVEAVCWALDCEEAEEEFEPPKAQKPKGIWQRIVKSLSRTAPD